MRKKSTIQLVILSSVLLLASCISDVKLPVQVTNIPNNEVDANNDTKTPTQVSQQPCFTPTQKVPQEVSGQGIVILRFGWVFDLQNGQLVHKPEYAEDSSTYAVSPDYRRLAYRDSNKNQLVIASANRKPIQTFDWDPTWWPHNFSWLTNDSLLIYLNFDPQIDQVLDRGRSIIFNLKTGQSQPIPIDYPPKEVGPDTRLYPSYSPDLNYVVFATTNGEYILGKIRTQKTIASLPTFTYEPPVWSPSGSSILVAPNDLYLISTQGEISRLTYENQSKNDPSTKLFRHYSWSPDGKRIAVWIQTVPPLDPEVYTLAIYDLESHQLIDTCIPWENGPSPDRPLWSPDGKQLVVNANYRAPEHGWDVVIVNWADRTYEKIADTLHYLGWMVTTQ